MMQVTNAFVACSLFWGRMDKYRDRCGTYSLHPDLVVITGDFVDDDTSKEDMIRASMGELVRELDTEKYMIVLDHQPNDFEAQKESNVDLVLSGHTHGGQFFPINRLGELMGENDMTYGIRRKCKCDLQSVKRTAIASLFS